MLTGGYDKLRLAAAALATALLIAPVAAADPTTLITEHEANLPADNSVLRSGPERGPEVVAVSPPADTGMIQSPFDFQVKFRPHGGTQIDLDSLKVVYKRIPAIDLTARVKPFLHPDGFNVPSAAVPAGPHRIIVSIKDSTGHEGQADIRFEVAK